MKRLHILRIGSLLSLIITIVCHLVAISFDHWTENICATCPADDPLKQWTTSLHQRCYKIPLTFLHKTNGSQPSLTSDVFVENICFPKQYVMATDPKQAMECLRRTLKIPDLICRTSHGIDEFCKCDYSSSTKIEVVMAISASISLGILVFITIYLEFAKKDYDIQWLLSLRTSILIFSILCIIVVLNLVKINLSEDVREFRFRWSMVHVAFPNESMIKDNAHIFSDELMNTYEISCAWCYKMEVCALNFAFIALVLHQLMFSNKHKSERKINNFEPLYNEFYSLVSSDCKTLV